MNDLRKAAEQALEVLKTRKIRTWGDGHEDYLKQWNETIEALRQALTKTETISIDWKKSLGGIRQHALEDTHSV
jgi:hypothetical protein